MKLSKNFTLEEFTRSSTATKLGIDNTPTDAEICRLRWLVAEVVQPARGALGKPIHVNSGFRCVKLNIAVKGAKGSQHMKAEAGDLELGNRTKAENEELFNWIRDNCEFDQLINEHDFSWVHVSYISKVRSDVQNRNQILKIG